MLLYDQIKIDTLQARKDRDTVKANVLNTLAAEAFLVSKSPNRDPGPATDAEVIKIVKKFIENIDFTINELNKAGKDASKPIAEKAAIEIYAPSQMSDDELKQAIDSIVSTLSEKSIKQMGSVMAVLKEKYAGRYDGTKASSLTRAALL